MTLSVSQLSDALAQRLDTVGIRALPYLGDTFTPPVALVAIHEIDYHIAFGNQTEHNFTVFVVVARGNDRAGIAALDDFMSNTGPTSIRQALESEPATADGLESSIVTKGGPPAALTINGAVYATCPFEVLVRA